MRPRTKRKLLPRKASATADPGRFHEAIDFFRARVPMRKSAWSRLGTAARQRGFTVADVAQLDVINDVWLALDDAIARGATFDEFKKTVAPELTKAWAGTVENPPARVETIFRTNVMQANNAGRHAQMTDPVVLDRRPYWQYVDIDDGAYNDRECPICKASHGVILRADDPWWQTSSPPRHFNCFPCDVEVEGRFVGALKARYAGKMIELETRLGRNLRVTPNHPVLTMDGFAAARTLRDGVNLITDRGVSVGRSGALRSIAEHDKDHAPSSIEQVFGALGKQRGLAISGRMGPLDFYGDAARFDGDVEVVGTYGELLRDVVSHRAQAVGDSRLVLSDPRQPLPVRVRAGDLGFDCVGPAARSFPRRRALALDAAGSRLDDLPLDQLRVGPAANIDASRYEFSGEAVARDAAFVGDLLHRFSGAVTTDEIVKIREFDFTGHVFDLESVGGWIVASGIYTSNCRCRTRPLTVEQAEALGVTVERPTVPSDPGFGAPPVTVAPEFQIDWSVYPAELAQAAREKHVASLSARGRRP